MTTSHLPAASPTPRTFSTALNRFFLLIRVQRSHPFHFLCRTVCSAGGGHECEAESKAAGWVARNPLSVQSLPRTCLIFFVFARVWGGCLVSPCRLPFNAILLQRLKYISYNNRASLGTSLSSFFILFLHLFAGSLQVSNHFSVIAYRLASTDGGAAER